MSGGRGGLPCTSEKARKREVSFLDGNLFLEAILGRESDNWGYPLPSTLWTSKELLHVKNEQCKYCTVTFAKTERWTKICLH